MSDTRLGDLAQDLSPEERRRMLEKIRKSLNPEPKDERVASPSPGAKEDLKIRLEKEVEKCGFWQKIWIRILTFFSGRKVFEVRLQQKLKEMRRRVDQKTPGLLTGEASDLSPVFFQGIYDLFYWAWSLGPVWDSLFKNPLVLQKSVGVLVESRVNDPKYLVVDLVTLDEMGEIYRKTGQKSALVKRMKEAVQSHTSSFPPSVFQGSWDDLLPLYTLRSLIQFPFRLFFLVAGHDPGTLPPQKYPPFRPGSLTRSLEYLERLYGMIVEVCRSKTSPVSLQKVLDLAALEFPGSEIFADSKKILSEVESLIQEAQRLLTQIPWAEVLQMARRDPFSTVKVKNFQMDIKDIYRDLLLVRFGEQIDDIFPQLRTQILQQEKDSLFQNQNSQLLEFYKLDINPLVTTYKLPQFSHVESINLINTFLSTYFVVHFQPLIRTLAQVVLQTFKVQLSAVLQVGAELEESKSKIKGFDQTLGPHSEDGKTLALLKSELSTKPTSHGLYTQLVEKKNRESQDLVNLVLNLLQKLEEILEGILGHTSPQMRSLLKIPYIMGGARSKISEAVQDKIKMIQKFNRLVSEINATENGTR